jgi:hypothetical protein
VTAFFTDVFRQALFDNPTMFDTAQNVVALLFRNAPVFSPDDPRYVGIETIDDLTRALGFETPITWKDSSGVTHTGTDPRGLSATLYNGSHYVRLENPILLPEGFPTSNVKAVAFVYQGTLGGVVNPVMMVTNGFTGPQGNLIYQPDGLYARPDDTANGARWLFGWADPPADATTATSLKLLEGPLALLKDAPPFDTSRTQHVWMFPQRVNLLANPSFEGGITHWRSNGTKTQVQDTADILLGVNAGRFSGVSPIIVESNTFPLSFGFTTESCCTIMCSAKGNGRLKIGLIYWPADYNETISNWGPSEEEVLELSNVGFKTKRVPRTFAEAAYGMVRLECEGTELIIDNLMVEPNWLPDWWYFDGDTQYGAPGDFSWYGNRQGASYSCWYNNRRDVVGRLFAWDAAAEDQGQILPPEWEFDPTTYSPTAWLTAPPGRSINRMFQDDVPVVIDSGAVVGTTFTNKGNSGAVLDAVMTGGIFLAPEVKGYVWRPASAGNTIWVPSAANLDIADSMTAIVELDTPAWPPSEEKVLLSRWGNSGITPGALGWLNGLTGQVTTPDTANLTITADSTITARVRFAAVTQTQGIVGQWGTSGTLSWLFYVQNDNTLRFSWSANGTAANHITGPSLGALADANARPTVATADAFVGIKVDVGSTSYQFLQSSDGVTWVNFGSAVTGPAMAATFNVAMPLTVGSQNAGVAPFRGRIYWTEMRTGLSPTGGTVVFRSDISDWRSGATFTSNARTWTVNGPTETITASTVGTLIDSSWILTLKADGKLQFLWANPPYYPWTTVGFAYTESTVAATKHRYTAVTYVGDNGEDQKEVAFWWSDNGTTWTQVGTTHKGAVAKLQSCGGRIEAGSRDQAGATRALEGKIYSFKVNNGVAPSEVEGNIATPGGEVVLHVDANAITQPTVMEDTFKAVTGQTVTIQRGSIGYVTTPMPAGGRPVFMLDGVDDKVEIPDNAVFNPANDFAVLAAVRQKVSPKGSFYVSKANTTTPFAGWMLKAYAFAGTGDPGFWTDLKSSTSQLQINVVPIARKNTVTVGFAVDREGTVARLTSIHDDNVGEIVENPTLGDIDNSQPIQIGTATGQTPAFEQFDFFGLVVVQGTLVGNELSNIATAMRDASDQYYNGDRWVVTADGQFMGLDLHVDDILVARHPQGHASPMRFDQVVWDIQVLTGGVTTSVEVEEAGLVYRWVPAGTLATPHLDVLYVGDTSPEVAEPQGSILPYQTDPDDVAGVVNPWG